MGVTVDQTRNPDFMLTRSQLATFVDQMEKMSTEEQRHSRIKASPDIFSKREIDGHRRHWERFEKSLQQKVSLKSQMLQKKQIDKVKT
jgi:hypothetical protein